ncbi:MAG: nucleotidyltransferase substrate binding protein [Syntrophomonadaceae bacterium]|jgi:nucleotidyltransferase substrate binding protein (TIGR01987 family)|nr:nucleotidyltransferase substrate binding protein [Syntrophomonadaceae bacterium]
MGNLEAKLSNFKNALQRLKEAVEQLEQNDTNDLLRDGLIQRFEFTYELAWKATREYLKELGIVDRNSPKTVFKEAYAQKIIIDETNWLLMLKDRNTMSHMYSEELSQEIARRIVDNYHRAFELLLIELEK